MKPGKFPRSVREAFGSYARLELHEPTPPWRKAIKTVTNVVAYLAASVLAGGAFGGLLTFVERL